MKKVKLLLSLLIFGLNILSAQNAFFIEEAEQNITKGNLNNTVNEEIKAKLDLDEYFTGSYSNFKNSRSYWLINLMKSHQRLEFKKQSTYEEYIADRDIFVKFAASNKAFQEAVYNCLFPVYKTSFLQLTNGESNYFLNEIENVLKYVKNFDLTKETADEAKLSYEFAYAKGKINAFIYRRIKNKDISKEVCEYWLNKLYNDLKSIKKIKASDVDYILTEKIDEKYYRGENYEYYYADFYHKDSVKKDIVYFIKDNNKFKRVAANIKIREFNLDYTKYGVISEQTSNGEFKISFLGFDEKINFDSKKDIKEFLKIDSIHYFLTYTDNTIGLLNRLNNTVKNFDGAVGNNIQRIIPLSIGMEFTNQAFIIYTDSTFVLLNTENKSLMEFKGKKIADVRRANYDLDKNLEQIFLIYADNTFELFNLKDKSIHTFNGRQISKILPVYNNNILGKEKNFMSDQGSFDNKVFLLYKDGICEIFNIENKTGFKLSDKKVTALDRVQIYISKFQHGFFYVNYADNSSDFLFFPQKDKMQKNSFNNKYEYFSSKYSLEVFLLKLNSGEQHLVSRNEGSLNFIKLNSEIDFITPTANKGEFNIKFKSGEKYLLKNATLIKSE